MTRVYELMRDPTVRLHWETALGPCPSDDRTRARYEMSGKPAGGWMGWEPIWSFDHPTIHGGRDGKPVLTALGLSSSEHFQLTANSCDLHRVIEHTHARLVGRFQSWLYEDCQAYDMQVYKDKLKSIFYHDNPVANPQVIASDVEKLPELCEAILEVEGGWPRKAFR